MADFGLCKMPSQGAPEPTHTEAGIKLQEITMLLAPQTNISKESQQAHEPAEVNLTL